MRINVVCISQIIYIEDAHDSAEASYHENISESIDTVDRVVMFILVTMKN